MVINVAFINSYLVLNLYFVKRILKPYFNFGIFLNNFVTGSFYQQLF